MTACPTARHPSVRMSTAIVSSADAVTEASANTAHDTPASAMIAMSFLLWRGWIVLFIGFASFLVPSGVKLLFLGQIAEIGAFDRFESLPLLQGRTFERLEIAPCCRGELSNASKSPPVAGGHFDRGGNRLLLQGDISTMVEIALRSAGAFSLA